MNRSFQNRIGRLSGAKPQVAYVFWVPTGRSFEDNLRDANQWLKESGLPAKSNPMMFEDDTAEELHVEIIEDFAAVMENAGKHTNRIGER